jgi:hypothetical protein
VDPKRGILTWTIAALCATLGAIGSAGATSANTDVTDIWWNPNKSGNGYQLINTGNFVFATGYLYDAGGAPYWISGELERTVGLATFTGPLYVTSGPYYGGPYDPANVTVRQAGTMSFVLTSVTTGDLSYTVDGVAVNEPLQRQGLTLDDYSGVYVGNRTQSVTGCLDPGNNGTVTDVVIVDIQQSGDVISVATTPSGGGTCTYTGAYTQLGRMGTVEGPYSCTSGETGTATLFEMNNVPYMFTARFQSHSTDLGCDTVGEMAGVIPR